MACESIKVRADTVDNTPYVQVWKGKGGRKVAVEVAVEVFGVYSWRKDVEMGIGVLESVVKSRARDVEVLCHNK